MIKKTAIKTTIIFDECEHDGDLHHYLNDLIQSGAKIISYSSNNDCETGNVFVSIENYELFITKFKETDSYELSSLNTY